MSGCDRGPSACAEHRVVAEALSSDVSSDSEGEVHHVSLSALSPSQLEDALPSASQSPSQRQIARYTRSRLALLDMQAAPSGFQALDKVTCLSLRNTTHSPEILSCFDRLWPKQPGVDTVSDYQEP